MSVLNIGVFPFLFCWSRLTPFFITNSQRINNPQAVTPEQYSSYHTVLHVNVLKEKQEAHRSLRSPEYQKLNTLLFVRKDQQIHH